MKRTAERLEHVTHHVAPSAVAAAAAGPRVGAGAGPAPRWDLVLSNGRVIDPASNTDAVLNVAIAGDKIAALGSPEEVNPEYARECHDCTGLVVSPGFIDLHSHCMNNDSARLQACDGVTTQLELELGTWPVDTFLAEREAQGAVINFGSSVGHIPTRVAALTGAAIPFSVTDPCCMLETKQTSNPAHRDKADPAALDRLMKMLGDGLDQGGIGFGAGIVYTPGADHKETYELIRTVAKHGVCLFVHIRQQHSVGMEDLHEMLVNAAISGASVHICHALATGRYGGRSMWADMLSMVEGINQQGIDVSLEQYPYPYGMTNIKSEQTPSWNPDIGLRQVIRSDTGELVTGPSAAKVGRTVDGSPTEVPGTVLVGGMQWLATGEFLVKETFDKYREEGGLFYGHWSDEQEACLDVAMAHPLVMIASDGIPFVDGQAHPRGAGTFCRFLGLYCREKGCVDLPNAIRRMTLGPAQRLEKFVPAMRTKGRISAGMDADLTVFDPATVIDRATLLKPYQASSGIAHVLCNGKFVVKDGTFCPGVYPGRAIRGESLAKQDRPRKMKKTAQLYSTLLEGQEAGFLSCDC